jgi:hypothetical protein
MLKLLIGGITYVSLSFTHRYYIAKKMSTQYNEFIEPVCVIMSRHNIFNLSIDIVPFGKTESINHIDTFTFPGFSKYFMYMFGKGFYYVSSTNPYYGLQRIIRQEIDIVPISSK